MLHRLSQGPAPVAEMTHGLMELLGMDRKKADGLVRCQLEAMKDKIDYRGKGHLAQLMPGAAGKAVLSVASRSKSGGVWNIEGTGGRVVRLSRGQEKREIRLSSLQTGHTMLGGQYAPKDFLDRIPSLP